MGRVLAWVAMAALLATGTSAQGAEKAALLQRLRNAAESSTLDDPALKPWHLVLDVQLYDPTGKPTEQGTIEEWWAPDASKRIFTTPPYTATEISTSRSVFRTKSQPTIPYLLFAALNSEVAPLVPDKDSDKSELMLQVQSFGQVKLDCIFSYKPGFTNTGLLIKPPSPGAVPTTCLDEGADQLRVSWIEPEIITRNRIGLFQGRQTGLHTVISLYGVKAISQHVRTLDDKAFDPTIFTPGPDLESRPNDPVWLSGRVTAPLAVHKVTPVYPVDAKRNHISGAVMLIVTVGADGHALGVEPVGTPSPSLTESAVTAVKQIVYAPYLVNGASIPFKTTFTVHYHFGPA